MSTILERSPNLDVNGERPKGIIRGLGGLAFRETRFGRAPFRNRIRTTEFMTVDRHPTLFRESEPHPDAIKDPDNIPTIWHSLGWTEFIDVSTGQFLHDELAEAYPGHYVATAETPGVSKNGYPLSFREALKVSPKKIVDSHWRMAQSVAGKAPVILVGESAGGGNVVRMAKKNLDSPPEGQLNITEIHIVSGCIVASKVNEAPGTEIEPFRKGSDKAHCVKTTGRFFWHMGGDIPRTAAKNPRKALRCILSLGTAVVQRPKHMAQTVPAIAGNLLNLLPGTDWETIKEVFSQHQVRIYVGSRDALREDKMYQKLIELYPDNIRIIVVPGEGHTMVMDAQAVAEGLKITA